MTSTMTFEDFKIAILKDSKLSAVSDYNMKVSFFRLSFLFYNREVLAGRVVAIYV